MSKISSFGLPPATHHSCIQPLCRAIWLLLSPLAPHRRAQGLSLAHGTWSWGPSMELLLGTSISGETAWGTLQEDILPAAVWEGEVTAVSQQIHWLKHYLLKPCCHHPLHWDRSLMLRGEREDEAHQRHYICLQLLSVITCRWAAQGMFQSSLSRVNFTHPSGTSTF